VNNNAASLRKCFANANAMNDLWTVDARVMIPKGGTKTFNIRVRRDSKDEASATSKALETCANAAMTSWPWPSSDAIEGLNGGPGYIQVMSGMARKH